MSPLLDGLGLIGGSFCPHYDGEADRRPAFLGAVADGSLPGGWALDDGVAALFTDGVLTEAVSRVPGAAVHRVTATAQGTALETAAPVRRLG